MNPNPLWVPVALSMIIRQQLMGPKLEKIFQRSEKLRLRPYLHDLTCDCVVDRADVHSALLSIPSLDLFIDVIPVLQWNDSLCLQELTSIAVLIDLFAIAEPRIDAYGEEVVLNAHSIQVGDAIVHFTESIINQNSFLVFTPIPTSSRTEMHTLVLGGSEWRGRCRLYQRHDEVGPRT